MFDILVFYYIRKIWRFRMLVEKEINYDKYFELFGYFLIIILL